MNIDTRHMMAALRAVHETRGQTWPNPTVGCALVDPHTNKVITTGVTQHGGRPHAEINALEKAGPAARGAHVYVTLEPCSHASPGKPCSCAQGLIDAQVSAVYIGLPDPDPRVAGNGLRALLNAGIEVKAGILAPDCYHALRGHVTRALQKRPYITLKMAHSADGFIGRTGQRVNISAAESWERAYILRGKVDGVMIGINTAVSDDPILTNRNAPDDHQPVRIIIDTHAKLSPYAAMVQAARTTRVWVVSMKENATLAAAGVHFIRPASMAIQDIVAALHDAGMTHILAEGGATLAQNLIDAGLVDEALMIEGAALLGNGIPAPVLKGMHARNTEKIGPDTWRIYDSENALAYARVFFEGLATSSSK